MSKKSWFTPTIDALAVEDTLTFNRGNGKGHGFGLDYTFKKGLGNFGNPHDWEEGVEGFDTPS